MFRVWGFQAPFVKIGSWVCGVEGLGASWLRTLVEGSSGISSNVSGLGLFESEP